MDTIAAIGWIALGVFVAAGPFRRRVFRHNLGRWFLSRS